MSRLIISTDSVEIQEEARSHGVEVPFTRPAALATDTATTVDVVAHTMQWFETAEGTQYDAIMLLEPASPFARARDYDQAVELLQARGANAVVGVRPVETNSVYVGPLDSEGRISSIVDKMQARGARRRQEMPQEYTMNAALYLFRWDYFRAHRNIYHDAATTYGHVMEPEYSIEIDTLTDLHRAEFLVERGYVDMKYWRKS